MAQVILDEDQLELASSVRDVLEAQCPPALVRACMEDADAWRPLWASAVDLGWTSLAGESDGLGPLTLVAVFEQCGEAAAPIPLTSSIGMAAGALHAAGKEHAAVLEELAAGRVGTLALLAPGGRAPTAPFRYDGNRLSGTAAQVADATRAELFVVLAEAGPKTVLSVVRPGPGVELTPAKEPVDPTRPLADLTLDVEAEAVEVDLRAALVRPLVYSGAELVGLARRIVDLSVDYAKSRSQFGKPIGSFQGVKHRLADCYVLLERARSLTYAAAGAIEAEASTEDLWLAATLSKAAAIDAAVEAARAGVQVHGAMGMTWEHDMHLYLRRAWQCGTLTGDSRSLFHAAGTAYAAMAAS